ncbi:methyl-accepting chemotaxis protein [Rhizobium rhizogenes]|jgi:methyl-accepting chemotaxis protein|uniref:methyl-accepting chemotaxis protein n=1 Tax=Rhizobium rhizogenes TaxID=359 RepID=UPI0004DA5D71|nr:HAMP domain-containing methyl-accepting chemotaxis protein [Rhizobium rhizogenes]KEA03267.1 chemotaxis protein [Rhizobium rhizogenes]MQB35063.1 methyl-accepting chemotaxis protein [Rhizobium rhizogenes]QUE82940.1 MCP four helix bundle domain-containing protein [Rhizobium rhizogenes]TQO72856.1 HAMP domain-containing protein [Rhizobium rhizogenes]TRB50016.1 methyl-accepting chemotaxis protein [Rhizobium rhizogenes]
MKLKRLKQPSIRTSLIAIFSALAIIVVAFAYTSVNGLTDLHEGSVEITRSSLPSILAAKDIKSDMQAIQAAYFTYITASKPDIMQAAEESVKKLQGVAKDEVLRAQQLGPNAREIELLAIIDKSLTEFSQKGEGVFTLAKMSQYDEATGVLTGMMEASEPAFAAMDELVAIATQNAEAAVASADNTYGKTRFTAFAVIGLVLSLVLGSSIYALISIAKPIKAITASMTKLAVGDTESVIPYADRTDEIGQMAGAVEVFRQAAIANRRLELEAERNREIAEVDRKRLTQEADAAADKRLRDATSALADGLTRLAAGDLNFQLLEPMSPDFEALRRDLNSAVLQLRDTLTSVSIAAGAMNDGSREISVSTDNLSRRTEQQAASLEQTAAALDEITVNVANSSKRAEEARSIVSEATASATRSAKIVADAVEAMRRIESSSSQIVSIIGVIDEIAFQTNLLALNAGVEAARAGEAGKGFAVVAQEVRELAQRSAKAAKEIKDLIRKSGQEVENGVLLVRATGDALNAIEGHVTEINHRVLSIATSASEQAMGLGEVNAAVNQMDQVTQQNAGMVEETSAASAILASEATHLHQLVSQFNLGDAETADDQRSGRPVAVMQGIKSKGRLVA